MIITLHAVLLNDAAVPSGATPLVPSVQPLTWPEGEDGTIKLTVVNSAGVAVNVAGGTFVFTLRRRAEDASPVLSRLGAITDAAGGRAQFSIASADTLGKVLATYRYDVQYRDSTTKRWQVVPASPFVLGEIAGRPGDLTS